MMREESRVRQIRVTATGRELLAALGLDPSKPASLSSVGGSEFLIVPDTEGYRLRQKIREKERHP